MTGDAGCHAGLTADTEFRICLNMIKHGRGLLQIEFPCGCEWRRTGLLHSFLPVFGRRFFDAAGTVLIFRRAALGV